MKFVDYTKTPSSWISSISFSHERLKKHLRYAGLFPNTKKDRYNYKIEKALTRAYNVIQPNGAEKNTYFFSFHLLQEKNWLEAYKELKKDGLLEIDILSKEISLPTNKNFTKKVEKSYIASVLFALKYSNFCSNYTVSEILSRLSWFPQMKWIVSPEGGDLYTNAQVLEYLGYSRFIDILSQERKRELFEEHISFVLFETEGFHSNLTIGNPSEEFIRIALEDIEQDLNKFETFVISEDFEGYYPRIGENK